MPETLTTSDSVAPAGSNQHGEDCIVLQDTPRGEIELPKAIYEEIAAELPQCLTRGDDDRSSTPHFSSQRLRNETSTSVGIQTRNVWKIVELLAVHGIDCRVQVWIGHEACRTPVELPDGLLGTTKSFFQRAANANAQLSAVVKKYRAGQLVSRDNRQKFDDAALLCSLFPGAPIVLVVASQEEVELVAPELEERLAEKVHRAFGNHARPEKRITVATYAAFCSEDLRDAPFVIVPVWKPGYPRWMKMLSRGPYLDRIYFLRTVAETLSKRDDDDLLGRVGPVLLQPRQTRTTAHAISVYKFGGKATGDVQCLSTTGQNTQLDKRKLFWQHRRRNQAIAALARNFDSADGPIAVLVETMEHAEELSRLLPGWLVVSNGVIPDQPSTGMIVTLTAAASWPKFRPRTLIFGIGGAPSPWLLEWLTSINESAHAVRIIDLADGFDPVAARLAGARLNAYREAGCHWRPLADSVVQRVGRELREAQKHEKSSRRRHHASC